MNYILINLNYFNKREYKISLTLNEYLELKVLTVWQNKRRKNKYNRFE